ncbi:MAG: hypothetical protein FWG70_09110 [Oscillospiraceae bacterium]|nr:hypothetical protein [Oscillospiraceae bacterium]
MREMYEMFQKVWRLIGMAIGTILGLALMGLGGFVVIAVLRPDLLNTEVTIEGGGPGIVAVFAVGLIIGGIIVIGRIFGVKIKFGSKRKIKIKYVGKPFSNISIFFGIVCASCCIPCFLQTEQKTAFYISGAVLFLIGAGLIAVGIITKIKDDFKKRKRLTKNDRYAIKATVTEVREGNISRNDVSSQFLICRSEQTGLEYISDDTWSDLYEYIDAQVWVYLDPDDQSEYGQYFVDLESLT